MCSSPKKCYLLFYFGNTFLDEESQCDEAELSKDGEEGLDVSQSSYAPDLDSFEHITEDMCLEETLYFFARSDREKEHW